ncbi:HTH-type transcriptional regulator YofA [mine drainage metagenome]|uniref:HTH-type transcriptional regulator YofA n=1 Tax=mine drainage metagenome TaxID=410659 RepID=A0A1J5R1S0_9ZZZZ
MDLHQLRIFVAVAANGNLTRASEILCLSQPAVSAQIKALEEELGVSLFFREARGMGLTPAGKVLLTEASSALKAAKNVVFRAQHFRNGISGEFKLGTISEPVILHLSELLSTLLSRHPDLHISLSQGISGDIIDQVLTDRINAGYVIGPIDNPNIIAIKVAPITLRIVAPVAWKEQIINADWKTIETYPWISTPAKCSFNQISSLMFAKHGIMPKTIIESDQEITLKKLVSSNIGLTLLREDLALAAEAMGELIIWPIGAEISYLYFIYSRIEEDSPALNAIMNIVKDVWKLPSALTTSD